MKADNTTVPALTAEQGDSHLAANGKLFQRVQELYPGMALYKVHVDMCREQDKNAQVMGKEAFNRLQTTMSRDQRLESMPLCQLVTNKSGNRELAIISGHHRTRAARMAGVTEIFVMVYEEELTDDQVKAKQLAHNALVGYSDPQLLKEIYDSILDVNAKIDAGLTDVELDASKFKSVSVDDISLEFDFQQVRFMFLPSQMSKLDEVVKELQKEDVVLLGDKADWDKFCETIRKLSGVDDIRNMASIVDKMCDVVLAYIVQREIEVGKEIVKGSDAVTRKQQANIKKKGTDQLKKDNSDE